MNAKDPTPFEMWFVECILMCVNGSVGPDDYIWDLNNCEKWKRRFEAGHAPEEAVYAEFYAH